MARFSTALLALAAWEGFWWCVGKADRRKNWQAAHDAAVKRGKPLLVVGEPDGEYPCGDVTVDIRETSVCPVYAKASVEDLSQFSDKQFGAVFASHVIEHLCEPEKGLAELARVADEVFVSYPRMWRAATLLVPGHRWLIHRRADGSFTLIRWFGTCNVATRYGMEGYRE